MKLTSSYAASAAVCLMVALVMAPCADAIVITPPPPSPAVTKAAVSNSVILINKALASLETQADVASTRTAIGTLFANLEETGNNAMIQSRVLAQASTYVSQGATQTQIATQQAYLTAAGSHLTVNQYQGPIVGTSPADRQQAIATLQSQGMLAVEQLVLARLQTYQTQVAANTAAGKYYAAKSVGRARLKTIADELRGGHVKRVEGTFCTYMAFLFAIAAVWCPPMAIIAAIYSLLDALGLCQ